MASRPLPLFTLFALAVGTFAVGVAVTVAARPSEVTKTSCATVLGSDVCTWIVLDGETPVEAGVTIPMSFVDNVPLDAEPAFPPTETGAVAFPAEARDALGVDHLGINWEAHGHPPAVFMTPHFDFHFYNDTPPQVAAITCSDTSKPSHPPAGYVLPDMKMPDGSTLVGACVPHMGMHALLEKDLEGPAPFSATMIVGYYARQPIFFEPMIARARLLERTDFTLHVPEVEGLPDGVRYPREFRAEYDAAQDQYRFVFSGFSSN